MRPRVFRGLWFAAMLSALGVATCAQGGDLSALREALKAPLTSAATRERELRSIGDELQNLRECNQALFLPEWRDDDIDSQIAAVDRRVWLGIAKRYADAIHWQLESNDVASQIAALESVGEAGDLAAVVGRRFDFVRGFVPDVLRAMKQPNPAVAAAAARALGRVRPDAQPAIQTLKPLLDSEDE